MVKTQQVDIEIDKLTRSIENAITDDSFKTEIVALTIANLRSIKKADWLFGWKTKLKTLDTTVYKLVIVCNDAIIQGLVSLQDWGNYVFMLLIESNRFNRGATKVYLGAG